MKPSNRSAPLARCDLRDLRHRRGEGQPEADEQCQSLAEHGEILVQCADLTAEPVEAAGHGGFEILGRIA